MEKSENIKEITKSLVALQAEIKNPNNTSINPFFNSHYAPLNEILADLRPLLSRHNLAMTQDVSRAGGDIVVSTLLMHISGEWVEQDGVCIKPIKEDPQSICSAISYARRYSILSMFNICGGGEDDDGNNASKTPKVANCDHRPDGEPNSQEKPNSSTNDKVPWEDCVQTKWKPIGDSGELAKKLKLGRFKKLPDGTYEWWTRKDIRTPQELNDAIDASTVPF